MPVSPVSPLALTAHRKRLYFVSPSSGFEPGLPKSAKVPKMPNPPEADYLFEIQNRFNPKSEI